MISESHRATGWRQGLRMASPPRRQFIAQPPSSPLASWFAYACAAWLAVAAIVMVGSMVVRAVV